MNSKSSNDFRWSIRLTDNNDWINTCIGIASKLQETDHNIAYQDENAIVFYPFHGIIRKGQTAIQKNIIAAKEGDEINFRFQPKSKKFTISFVSSIMEQLILDC